MKAHSKEYINHINNLDIFDKLRVYNHYVANQLALKYNSEVKVYNDEFESSIEFVNHWLDLVPVPFADWISNSNVVINDHGKEWESNGWAQRKTTQLGGIYNWLWRFKDEINI